ncbi:DUF3027 domain-containing protein [Corynebacterium sp. 320]|uniref:DUF3027 domain-containing protein n=2 Tax=Corynebacteriaceae TaxID=1653 RepID=A0ABQ6VDQ5_9CORY|nr:DUF3027 domain-containing protein [Corynebacterium sp. 320]KAB1551505.1 DUF3027 domain-containing protein [Corynebacterium sp. 321]KAB1551667.1 DUF3027 domain-containing protein [Corynebacterium sp. 319]KAB3521048.1 DUF3027 domain-containing protein [Corynebacterium zhongnanshanii]KAB3525701.1 DUF3027 domain-containing protein [Corynebacterium sp. 250]KAB3538657.1 DUF3027 domain-containing protein [Corynebacterium sp. 366]
MVSNMSRSKRRRGRSRPAILFSPEAVDLARDALSDVGGDEVGEHLGATVSNGMVIHRFESLTPGYSGWEWNAVLACVPGTGNLTVSEVTLQAGKKAQLAPKWVPYEDRVRPGDLGPGDVLPPKHDDERLCPKRDVRDKNGFQRNQNAKRVLSEKGLEAATKRWRAERGRGSLMARRAEHTCATCAFFLPWRQNTVVYGICSNEYSADGQVVDSRYGCGAHSLSKEEKPVQEGKRYGVFDDGAY